MNLNDIEILLVEDNPDDIEMTVRALKKHNLANKLHIVNDGQEALDFIFAEGVYKSRKIEQGPKLVLLDIKLPKISGLEVLRKIKSTESLKKTPVVMLTSSKEDKDILESYNLGVNSYIVKPVNFENFLKAVTDLGFYWLLLNQPPNL